MNNYTTTTLPTTTTYSTKPKDIEPHHTTPGEVYERVDQFRDPFEAWSNYYVRRDLARIYGEWASGLASWLWTATFTTRDIHGYETMIKSLRWMMFEMNKRLYGKNFKNKVGHNYFSYLVGMEKQDRGAYHFHMIGDEPIDFQMVHDVWGNSLGFVWIEPIKKIDQAVNYVCKYIAKDGEVDLFIRKNKVFPPRVIPTWWKMPGKYIYQASGEKYRHLVIGAKPDLLPVSSGGGFLPALTTLDKKSQQLGLL